MAESMLDNKEILKQIDSEGMADKIGDLPAQCREAWAVVQRFPLPREYGGIDNVVVAGMGGSAIGGDLVRCLVEHEMGIPLVVCRDYELPNFVGPRTLLVASSYSGQTEETLNAFRQGVQRGAKALAICTGGELREAAAQAGVPVLQFHYQAQPRAALGHSAILLLGVLQKLGLVLDKTEELTEAVQVMEQMSDELKPSVPLKENLAKQLARDVWGRLPIVYGAGILAEVARRWKEQFNENSKAWAFFETFPGLNHNAIVGYEFPKELVARAVVILLRSSLLQQRVLLRYQITCDILAQRGISFHLIEGRGRGALAQMFSTILIGDFSSYYLAILHRIDPTPVEIISFLKERLAQA